MNKTLRALLTKLNWQMQEVCQELALINHELSELEQQCLNKEEEILNASQISAFILPEREIARLNFVMTQQQQRDELQIRKAVLLSSQERLKKREMRLAIEINMLEKYQEKQKKELMRLNVSAEQHQQDEWASQQGYQNEN